MKHNLYRPKEISWLSFNHRVLQQALRKDVPFYERIKFLGIYSSNMDEFFRVRVATLKRLSKIPNKAKKITGYDPVQTLQRINSIVQKQSALAQKAHEKLFEEMKKYNVKVINCKELSKEDFLFVDSYFHGELKNSLIPIMILNNQKNYDLVDDNIYFGVKFISKINETVHYSIIQLPTQKFNRFVILPDKSKYTKIVYLDDIIKLGLPELYRQFAPSDIKAFTFKITKDAELDIEDDIQYSYLDQIEESLKKRKKGRPVRFIYDKDMSKDLLETLMDILKITSKDTIIAGGNYHNTKDLMKFPNVFGKDNEYLNIETLKIPLIENSPSIFDAIKKQDIVLMYPYHSFGYFIEFLRQSATDIFVNSIYITIYRLSKNSDVVNALLTAIKNGKKVTVVIELQARFDESDNIHWSKVLDEAGAKVIYGVRGLKVHSKLCLVTRVVEKQKQLYASVGTGNHNETTSKIYTDISILTYRKEITEEVESLFDFFLNNYKHYNFRHLIVSPFNSRFEFTKLIKQEIENARRRIKAYIYIKINNLDDRQIINLLYEANKAGVEVVLLVRGMFSLITEVKGISDKIAAFGVVDMFLEHSRFFIFCNNKNPLVFISSSDFMVRNIDRRVEVTMPVYDKRIKDLLMNLFEIYRKDNVSARILDKKLKNRFKEKNHQNIRSQIEVYKFLKKFHTLTSF
mgnify:CR=1 FL=1